MTASELETCMEAASSGSREAASRFFRLFLDTELFVPERLQPVAIHNQAEYPNLIINILALKAKDHALVPVFSQPGYAEEWAGKPLALRKISGAKLRDLMPEGWWLCVNPGQEFEKEISAWEIERLKDAASGISSIIAELFSENSELPLSLRPLTDSEYPELQASLKAFSESHPKITALWTGLEEHVNETGKTESQTLLAGLLLSEPSEETAGLVKAEIGKQLIGGIPFRMFHESDARSLQLSVFQKLPPLFQRKAEEKKRWWKRLMKKGT